MSYQPKSLFSEPGATVKVAGPKPLFGNATVRKRIEVKESDLSGDKAACKAALQLILTTKVESLSQRDVLEWGAAEQSSHSEIIQSLFQLLNCPKIARCRSLLNEVIDFLRPKKGFFEKIFKKELGTQINDLTNQKEALYFIQSHRDLREKLLTLKEKIEPYIISCEFFSKYEGVPKELFLSRLDSLLTTKLTIETNLLQEDTFNQNLSQLIDSINQVLLTDYPLYKTHEIRN